MGRLPPRVTPVTPPSTVEGLLSSRRARASVLALALLPLTSCGGDGPVEVVVSDPPVTTVASAHEVTDLTVVATTATTLTLRWTQVDDGEGYPARYRVKYAAPPIDWSAAAIGCQATLTGDAIDSTMTCVVGDLEPSTSYEIQAMSFRTGADGWEGAVYSNVASGSTTTAAEQPSPGEPSPGTVQDLDVVVATDSTLTVRWTQVDDGTGGPARYRIKYAPPPFEWDSAATACTISGDAIGAEATCLITGLEPDAAFEVQLMSYRSVDGVWEDATYSNLAAGQTTSTPSPSVDTGIWIGPTDVAALPTNGPAWDNLSSAAQGSCGTVDLADQEQTHNVCIMAKALVFARTGDDAYGADVLAALRAIVAAPPYDGRALSLGRELGAYVIAADLIGLSDLDPVLDEAFRSTLRTLLTTYTWGGPENLIDCHEDRPNNWGTHCGGSRAAVAAYLGDDAALARVAKVFKGWLGDRSSYAGFTYGDLSWQCDPSRPVGINPPGCTRNGLDIGGVIPDDQRRAGSFTWPPPKENYVWEALQGALLQAVILERAGYPAFTWEDRALQRAMIWLYQVADYPAEGDDTWQIHVINHYAGSALPAVTPARAGKNVGWTDWTHGR